MSSMRLTLGKLARRLALFAAVLVLLAYPASRMGLFEWPRAYDPLALPDLAKPPGVLTGWQLKLVDAVPENCAFALSRAGLVARLRPDQVDSNGCSRVGTLEASRLSDARLRPEVMRCAMVARLYMWERHSLQPDARRILGEPVAEILHFGSYNCRSKRGGTSLSEHATANAFDISGFKLASGRTISLKRDWASGGRDATFLRAARQSLCDYFNVTLSPDYNADHADHFHVDMGWWQTCR